MTERTPAELVLYKIEEGVRDVRVHMRRPEHEDSAPHLRLALAWLTSACWTLSGMIADYGNQTPNDRAIRVYLNAIERVQRERWEGPDGDAATADS